MLGAVAWCLSGSVRDVCTVVEENSSVGGYIERKLHEQILKL